MHLESTPIPEGSYEIRIWDDGVDWHGGKITVVLNLKRDGDTAIVSMAHGHLSNEMNTLMGLEAIKLGFKKLVFYVPKGQEKVTRWATYTHSDDHFDWYAVNLERALEQYLTDRAL